MPIFEYACPACGRRVELLQKSAQAPSPRCSDCPDQTMVRLLSGFAVGSGRPDTPACPTCPGASGGASPCLGGQCPMA